MRLPAIRLLQTWATEVLPDARATVVSLFAGALVPLGLLATAGRARWRAAES